jgi:hypothetical protein
MIKHQYSTESFKRGLKQLLADVKFPCLTCSPGRSLLGIRWLTMSPISEYIQNKQSSITS